MMFPPLRTSVIPFVLLGKLSLCASDPNWRDYEMRQCDLKTPENYERLVPPVKTDPATGKSVPITIDIDFSYDMVTKIDDDERTIEIQGSVVFAWSDYRLLEIRESSLYSIYR